MFIKNKGSAFGWLIVGLGNPGIQYEGTRHNAGFMAADKLAELYNADFNKNRHNAVYGECKIGQSRVLIAKPQTFMNLSGRAVTELCSFYKIPYEKVIIMFDDISLDVGKIRIRRKGSHGGHNGMRDITELAGTEDIKRIKIGVGKKPHPDYDLKDWVLGKIPDGQKAELNTALDNAAKAAAETVINGIDSAMNKYSS